MVSGSISPSCSEYFSPFPHGTGSLSVSQEYLALPDGAGRFRQDFTGPALLRIPTRYQINFAYRTVTFFGPSFQMCSAIDLKSTAWSYNPNRAVTWLVWANPRSLATTCGITIVFFSYGYLDVSVPHVRLPCGMVRLQRTGLPHSEISGSKRICRFPKLIAACHVLLRLWEPRHPPCALSNFLNLLIKIDALLSVKFVNYFLPICQWTLLWKTLQPVTVRGWSTNQSYLLSLSIH
jgi:hypothetical protein